jgi:hypothetical protein
MLIGAGDCWALDGIADNNPANTSAFTIDLDIRFITEDSLD